MTEPRAQDVLRLQFASANPRKSAPGWAAFVGLLVSILAIPSRAEAPVGRYVVTADTVHDHETGLVWARQPSANAMSWAAAENLCESLATDGGGFRLPSVKELLTIVDMEAFDPAIDSDAFPDTGSELYWSGSVFRGLEPEVWLVDFGYGWNTRGPREDAHRVRCCRVAP